MWLLHEYQDQGLLKKYTVPIPKVRKNFKIQGAVVKSVDEIDTALKELGNTTGYAVKSQVLTGGRGLGHFKENNFKGGVHVVTTPDEVKQVVPNMIGKTLVTKQTGPNGIPCNALYIVEKVGKNINKFQMSWMKNIFLFFQIENIKDLFFLQVQLEV